jgi:IS605 OrfB family transposase
MRNAIIRTDKWPLQTTQQQLDYVRLTQVAYRSYCRALSIVVLNNWPALCQAPSFSAAVERLIHPTAKNPSPRHTYFSKRFYKFPSYLRRAAIEFVKGQVSSYLTRYGQWLDGDRRRANARPPAFTPDSGCYPSLYRGQMIRFDEDCKSVDLKLWNGREWLWHKTPVKSVRQRHLQGKAKSPALILARGHCHLSVPVEIRRVRLPDEKRVCSVDVGINTLATASIITSNGTVVARRFLHPAADIDRRDKRSRLISKKARKTGNLSKGFCKGVYRKIGNINKQIAQITSKELVTFALAHGADVIVFEDLKGWRPKAGRKRSTLRQRFHGWLHRSLATLTEEKFVEAGGQVAHVYARGTSSWAFDGTGKIRRDKSNAALATFSTGKQYNADLNASYNIGARYWAWKHKLTRCKDGQLPGDRSSSGKPRMPVTLSTLWQRESEAPYQCTA